MFHKYTILPDRVLEPDLLPLHPYIISVCSESKVETFLCTAKEQSFLHNDMRPSLGPRPSPHKFWRLLLYEELCPAHYNFDLIWVRTVRWPRNSFKVSRILINRSRCGCKDRCIFLHKNECSGCLLPRSKQDHNLWDNMLTIIFRSYPSQLHFQKN